MARPFKEGLDYFELDCVLDDNLKLIQAEYGLKGFAIVVKLYQKIYGGRGYYCEWNKDVSLLFTSENGLTGGDTNLIEDVIQSCIKRNIFSGELFEKYGILTSRGIQKRYFNAVARREFVSLKKEYLLIDVRNFRVSVDNNRVSVSNNEVNVDDNPQRKEEKRKEEKRRVEESREEEVITLGKNQNVYITPSEYKLLSETFFYRDTLIDDVSDYLSKSDRSFNNHFALIMKIAKEDRWPKKTLKDDERREQGND